jgi:hypothetical protein
MHGFILHEQPSIPSVFPTSSMLAYKWYSSQLSQCYTPLQGQEMIAYGKSLFLRLLQVEP